MFMEKGKLKISKDLKIMQNLQLKNYLKVILREYGQGLGKNCSWLIFVIRSQISSINFVNMSGCINC